MRNLILFCLCFFAVGLSLKGQTCTVLDENFDRGGGINYPWVDIDPFSSPIQSPFTPPVFNNQSSMRMYGGQGYSLSGGVQLVMEDLTPTEISFWIASSNDSTNRPGTYFALRDTNLSGSSSTFFFINMSSSQRIYISGCPSFPCPITYTPNTWYKIEISNINWVDHTYQIAFDNQVINSQHTFSTNVDGLNYGLFDNMNRFDSSYLDELLFEVSPDVTIVANTSATSCPNSSDGSIILTPSGAPPFTYLWSNGDTTSTRSGLSAGSYAVTVVNEVGCEKSTIITVPAAIPVNPNPFVSPVSCFGGNDGFITSTPSGGTGPYTYEWGSPLSVGNVNSVSGLSPGTYSLKVTDSNGCEDSTTIFVSEPNAPLTSTSTGSDPACANLSNGLVLVSPSGGTAPYNYTWSPQVSTSSSASGLAQGTYQYTVIDNEGCTTSGSATITDPPAITITGNSLSGQCPGTSSGTIDISVSGGTPYQSGSPYNYQWNDSLNSTTQDLSNATDGSYSVFVTDANGCQEVWNGLVSSPPPFDLSPSVTDVTCPDSANGAIDLSTVGGTGPYDYFWSTFDNTEDISNLTGGWYYLYVTDANFCDHYDSVWVNAPDPFTVTPNITPFTSSSMPGAISIFVTGGTTGYSYNWSASGQTGSTVGGLAAGTYTVTITDGMQCEHIDSFVVGTATSTLSPSAFEMAVYPNPAQNSVKVAIPALEMGRVEISMVDMRGKIIAAYDFGERNGEFLEEIDLSNVAKGVYFLRVRQGEKTAVTRLVKE